MFWVGEGAEMPMRQSKHGIAVAKSNRDLSDQMLGQK